MIVSCVVDEAVGTLSWRGIKWNLYRGLWLRSGLEQVVSAIG
jgi:hypothetical protein